MKYVMKPIEKEAWPVQEVSDAALKSGQLDYRIRHALEEGVIVPFPNGLEVVTNTGTMLAGADDYLVLGIGGEFYPVQRAIFEATYALPESSTIWEEVQRARARAHAKHGDNSIEAIEPHNPRWLSILVEEVGEVAHELTYDAAGSLRSELIDVLSVVSAWADKLDSP